jgi:4-hydroxy-tetrahydrodipicolinate reductase
MVRIVISGVCGKMGLRILTLAMQDKQVAVAGAIESALCGSIGKVLEGQQVKVESDESLERILRQADVLVEFTSPAATISHLESAEKAKKAMVIGTTGFEGEEVALIKKTSAKIPIVLSPNMSIGMNLLFKLAAELTHAIPDYDIEIIEMHHNKKKDAPSGTAVKLAEIIDAAEKKALGGKGLRCVYGREGMVGPRKRNEIGVFAVRAGDIVGDHTILFAGTGERLEITHRAHSRDALASGAVAAAKWIAGKKPGLYDMQDVLGLKNYI